MKKRLIVFVVSVIYIFSSLSTAFSQEKVMFNTHNQLNAWSIPKWSKNNEHYVSPILTIDENSSNFGETSVKINVSFSSENWSAGIIETEGLFDLTLYQTISFEVYLPENAPHGVLARTIIVAGKDYTWIEMAKAVNIPPGKRTVIKANLKRGNKNWNGPNGPLKITDMIKSDIKKIAIRIESNSAEYEGPIYIDRIKFLK